MPSPLKTLRMRLALVKELFGFLWAAKQWWLIPLMVALLGLGLLIALTSSTAIAPFLYPLF